MPGSTSKSAKLRKDLLKSLGPIKTFLYTLAETRKWKACDFSLPKIELRVKYNVINYGISSKIKNMCKSDTLDYLVSISKKLKFK